MRPIYETEQHLSAEKKLADFLQEKFNCTFEKLTISERLDYAAVKDGRTKAFFELKCRTNTMNKYPSAMISAHKVHAALKAATETNLPVYLAVQWTDAIGYTEIKPELYEYKVGGRKDRQDPHDIHLQAYIPINLFKVLTKNS